MTKSYRQIATSTSWFTMDPLYVLPNSSIEDLFPSAKRKYVNTHDVFGYTLATLHTGKILYRIGETPVYALYFLLDDFGDNALPVDTAFMSPMLARSAAETMRAIRSWREVRDEFRNIGEYIGQAANAQLLLPSLFHEYMDLVTFAKNFDGEFETAQSVLDQFRGRIDSLGSRMREVGHIFVPD